MLRGTEAFWKMNDNAGRRTRPGDNTIKGSFS